MTRITSPFDHFVRDLQAWIDSAWFVWLALAACILIVVLSVILVKARAKARARIPQYRRQTQT